MTEIRVFSRNPNFLAVNKMQRADREQGEASSLAARGSFTRSQECSLFVHSLRGRKTIFYFLFKKLKKKRLFMSDPDNQLKKKFYSHMVNYRVGAWSLLKQPRKGHNSGYYYMIQRMRRNFWPTLNIFHLYTNH